MVPSFKKYRVSWRLEKTGHLVCSGWPFKTNPNFRKKFRAHGIGQAVHYIEGQC